MTPRNPVDVGPRDPPLVAKNQAPAALTENGEPAWTTPANTHTEPRNPTMPHTPRDIGRSCRLVAGGPRGATAGRSTGSWPIRMPTVYQPAATRSVAAAHAVAGEAGVIGVIRGGDVAAGEGERL